MMDLKVKRLNENAIIPKRANPGDLGFDLFAVDTVVVQAGQTVSAKTGVACEFPEGWGACIKARSSQGKRGLDVFGGVVDSGYRGEIIILLHNSADPHSEDVVIYEKGEKIAQLVLVQVFPGTAVEVSELETSVRGEKGFGSSGQ
jgi:dUTP pyrophosphatase